MFTVKDGEQYEPLTLQGSFDSLDKAVEFAYSFESFLGVWGELVQLNETTYIIYNTNEVDYIKIERV